MGSAGRHAAARRRRRLLAGPAILALSAVLTVGATVALELGPRAGRDDVAAEEASSSAPPGVTTPTATTPAAAAAPPTTTPAASTGPALPAYPAGFDPRAHSTTKADSPWVIVNKSHPIRDEDYAPRLTVVGGKEVATTIAEPLGRLLDAAADAGSPLRVLSGFRSYGRQAAVYGNEVARLGSRAAADRVSARPGHSEHQTGLAVDLDDAGGSGCQLNACFASTRGGRWLAAHAGEYGFLVRYTAADAGVTGYDPEPWHLRYVGTDLVAAMAATGVSTLEEFFGVSGGDYPDDQ
ncbi:MAG: M15 family metallopeptidase [Nocardioides sp.]|uniref:M15 family metallopeptidase n=1 Tax=Nocardioides sp. TaxID=35761 RepID=UPI0039E25AEE